jgi:gamma-glutamyltranspeptidase
MPKLANTLNIISENSSVFYGGFLTDLIIHEINENGSISIILL